MNETLEHHGILGMKWGVRRYQNKDGTWTEEGKEHRSGSMTADDYFKLSSTERVDSPIGKELLSGESYKKYASARDKQEEIENKVVSDKASDFYDTAHAVAENYKAKAGENYDQETYDYYDKDGGLDAHNKILNEYAKVNEEYGKARKDEADAVQSLYDEAGPLSKKYFGNEYRLTYQDVNELAYDRFDSDREKARRSGKIVDPVEAKKIFTQEELDYVLKRDVSDSRESEQNQLMVMEMLERSGIMDSISNKDFEKEVLRFEKDPHNYVAPTKDETKHSDTVSDFLMHYGVKGQSWGKRNYQFEDGTLTEEGKERYSTNSGGVRGRRRTTNTMQGEDVHKTESVNQGKAPQMTQQVTQSTTAHAHDLPTDKKNNMMSDDEYAKAKQELAKRDFVQVYDVKMGKMIYVKKDEFTDHILRLAGQGIEVKMPYLDSSDTSEESMADIRMKNAEVRYWNELVEKAKSQTYAGPKSEGLHTREDQKAAREAMAERREKARVEAEQKKARLEDNRKRTTTMAQSDSSENILSHHGILGMKWGIRRYQNADGSLTAAGRKRYGVDENDGQRNSSGQSPGSNSDTTTRTPAKSASEMTDQELNQALNRLRMEQQYNELTGAKSSNQYQNQQNFSTPPSNTGNLSNAELQAYITRLDMEKRYAQLTAPPPKEVSAGKKFMNDVVGPAINQVAKAFIVASLSKALGLKGDGDNGGNNNNNNGGKKNNNDDSQYKSLKKELNDLKSMMGSQRKQDSSGNQKRESSRDRDNDSESSSSLPEPQRNTHRDSIFSAARDAARQAREQQREQKRQERAQKREDDRVYRDTFAEVRRNVRDYQRQEREERQRQSLIDDSRRARESQNRWASVSAFLSGLERQNGIQYTPKAQDYRTSGEKYLDDYIARMGR